jgi:hypothetical protein
MGSIHDWDLDYDHFSIILNPPLKVIDENKKLPNENSIIRTTNLCSNPIKE